MSKSTQIDISAENTTLGKKGFKGWLAENCYIILAFFVPFLILGTAFALYEVYPFGDKQILVTDFWQQYYPFYCDFHSKLQEGSSMLWSWGTGLGTNYISLIAYYLASPLNLLLYFVPAEFLREALTVFLLIKVGCSGMFTAMFLKTVFKRNDFSLVFFSMLFALCSFTMGYYWNIIWFDAFALFPLVVLGTYNLLIKGKYKMYVIALALTMLTNYYIGFFVCIFTVIMFIATMIITKPGWKVFFTKLVTIGGFSLLGLGICAIFFIPTLMALQTTHSAVNTIPGIGDIYDWKYANDVLRFVFDILGNAVAFTNPTEKEGLPNVYCGFICVILSAFYFKCNKITLREKAVSIGILLLLLYCCVYKLPNFIIHGFHLPNMLPYRFSFLICFVLVVMAYRAFLLLNKVTFADIFIMLITATVFVIFAYTGPQTISESGNHDYGAVSGTIAVSLVYLTILALRKVDIIPKQAVAIGIFAIMLVEIVCGAMIGVRTVRVTAHEGYPDQNEPIQTLISNIEAQETDDFYRMEMQQNYTINDSTIYGYRGVSLFSSTVNESITNFVKGMGMIGWDAGNRYYYCETSPVTNAFLNLKYLLARRTTALDTVNWELIESTGGAASYRNKNVLPMGFMANSNIKTFDYNKAIDGNAVRSAFDAQNSLFRKATGIEQDVFVPIKGDPISTGFPVTIMSETSYNCNATSEAGTFTMTYTITEDNTPVYAYTSCENCENNKITITSGSRVATSYEVRFPYIISLGVLNKGETVKIAIPYTQGTSGNCNLWVCGLDQELFEQGISALADESYNITDFNTSDITGTITAKQDGTMYTSIPYEDGWTAYVDGKQVEINPLANNAMVSVDLTAGEHTVRFKYVPKGFALGAVICIVAIIIFIAIIAFEYFYLKKKKNCTLLQPIAKSDDIIFEDSEEVLVAQKKTTQGKSSKSKKKK